MKAIILGARGLAGSAFMRVWPKLGIECVPLTRENYTEHRGSHADIFVNANGNSSKFLARKDPDGEHARSVAPVEDSLQHFNVDRYVLLSSSDVYPNTADPAENAESAAIDPGALSHYGRYKFKAEQVLATANVPSLTLRLGGLIGPGLRKNPIYDLLYGDTLFVHPDSQFGYLHTDDLARATLELLQGAPDATLLNLAGRGLVRIADVMKRLQKEEMPIASDAPRIHFEINTKAAETHVELPTSEASLTRYLDEIGAAS